LPFSEINKSPKEWLVRNPRFRVHLIAGGVGAILLALTATLWNVSLLYLNMPAREAARQQARQASERLGDYLNDQMTTIKTVKQFYGLAESMLSARQVGDVEALQQYLSEGDTDANRPTRLFRESDFQAFCNAQVSLKPGLLAIFLADNDGIPIWIASDAAGMTRQDINLLTTDLKYTNALAAADENSQMILTEPLSLPLHGMGMLAAVPLMRGQRPVGFIVGILPFQDMFSNVLKGDARKFFQARVEQAGRVVYPPPDESSKAKPALLWDEATARFPIALGNQRWSISMTPLAASKHSPFNWISMCIAVLGLCLSLVAAGTIHRLLWRAVRLQNETSNQRSLLESAGMSLMETKAQLDLIINSVDEGIVLYDEQLAPVQANAAFLTMFQMTTSSQEMTDLRAHHEAMVRLFGRETRYWVLFEAIRRDPARAFADEIEPPAPKDQKLQRARSFLRRAVAVADASDRLHGILVVYKDVTTFKDVERVKDDFLSSVTHELRSPLASIKGFAEMIQRDQAMPVETRAEFVTIICEEASRLQHLIEELLDLRRLQSQGMPMRIVAYDLRMVVDDVMRATHAVWRVKNIKAQARWDGPDTSARLNGDVAQIRRALRNLITNAVKYSPPGGSIDVHGICEPDRVALEVTDQGTGIDEKDLPYIFDQFYRGSSKGYQKGTGLGLAIVKHTVELHGGHLGVRSEVGHGTCFRVELPRHFKPPAPPTQRDVVATVTMDLGLSSTQDKPVAIAADSTDGTSQA
jgi:signal transduction histidine kinase